MDVLLYGLTLAWGTKGTSFDLPPEAAAVSFAICDQVTQYVNRGNSKKHGPTPSKARLTPKKGGYTEQAAPVHVDDGTGVVGDGRTGQHTEVADGNGGETKDGDEEMLHKRP